MTSAIIIDIVIVAALAAALFLGVRKGFILSLCSLLAVIVALIGAHFIAGTLAPRLADALEPRLAVSIQEQLDQKAEDMGISPDGLTSDSVLSDFKERGGIYQWVAETLEDAYQAEINETAAQLAASAAAKLASIVAHSLLFLLSFVAVLILWLVLGHALDLVAHLPVLSSLNRLAGGLLGLAKGLVLVWLAAWALCDLLGIVSPDTLAQTRLLILLLDHSPIRLLLPN